MPRVATRQRLKLFGVVAAVALVIVGPWVVRNLTTFEKPSLLGNGFGWVLLYGSCDAAFSGPHLGYWDDSCSLKNYPPATEESVLDQMARTKALDYLGDHKGRLPVVVAARIGRIWDVYRPFQNVELNDTSERRGHVASWAVLIGYWLVMPFAIFGLVVLRRRRIPIFPYLAIAAVGDDHGRPQLRDHALPRPGRHRAPRPGRGRRSTRSGDTSGRAPRAAPTSTPTRMMPRSSAHRWRSPRRDRDVDPEPEPEPGDAGRRRHRSRRRRRPTASACGSPAFTAARASRCG